MFSSLTNPNLLAGSLILALLQFIAALPWLYALDPQNFKKSMKNPTSLGYVVLAILGGTLGIAWFIGLKSDSSNAMLYGRAYGAVLHMQFLIGLFLYLPILLTWILPKTGAVALAAYREGWRQPMFWLILGFGIVSTWIAVVLPYFTFGDDYKMMKQIGFDIIMLAAALFGILAASISISEEIEGRTAITVMSKPINRRSFLFGKFAGILLACFAMSMVLAVNLNLALLVNPEFDPINKDRAVDPMPEQAKAYLEPILLKAFPRSPASIYVSGAAKWVAESFAHFFGVMLGFGQVMILIAIATALATRLPFVVNLVICIVVYLFGHLAPVVVRVTETAPDGGTVGGGLIGFLAKLFDVLLPALEFFNMGPAIIRETPIALAAFILYVFTVFMYAVFYTVIALIIGLLLFEDRDLA